MINLPGNQQGKESMDSAFGIIIRGIQMTTVKLWISDSVRRNDDAYDMMKEFAEKNGITGKDCYHLGLLTEEVLGMANQILHVYDGELWVESTATGYEIILEAAVHKKTSGKAVPTASPEGFMAKIAEMLNCSYVFENTMETPEDLAGMLPDYMRYGIQEEKEAKVWAGRWSLSAYRDNLRNRREENPKAEPALDELEKSIVAHLADEVTIGIHGHRIRLVISKVIRSQI
jgi:hypothetical protein